MTSDLTIGFVGAGQMARALARGFLRAAVVDARRFIAADPSPAAREAFLETAPGAIWAQDNQQVAEQAQLVFLAVKPQSLLTAVVGLHPTPTSGHGSGETPGRTGPLWVSIVAGASMARLRPLLGCGGRLVRVMPNTPCLVAQGASAFAADTEVTQQERSLVRRLLLSVGQVLEVEERLLDAVTGLSGSGPAYVFQWIEALADGGVLSGLSRTQALLLATQTVKGAAEMVLQTGLHPGELKDQVASPAGTTIAGLQVLEQRGVRGAIIDAVAAATRRAAALAGPTADAHAETPLQ